MKVEVNIEQLVLHGFRPGDRHRIAAAVKAELARSLAQEGVPEGWRQGAEVGQVDAGSLAVKNPADPRGIGRGIARTINKGVRR